MTKLGSNFNFAEADFFVYCFAIYRLIDLTTVHPLWLQIVNSLLLLGVVVVIFTFSQDLTGI